jgi:hypothetical protein
MLENWKRAWREAVANFHHELSGGEHHGSAHVRALRAEIATAKGALAELDREIRRTSRQHEAERRAEADCRRREALARNVGDDETVSIALDYAARHEARAAVLERKVAVLREERELLAHDIEEMERLAPNTAAQAPAVPPDATDDAEFRRLQQEQRERAAEARLDELKRRMR